MIFQRLAIKTANALGTPLAFLLAVASIVLWAVCGPFFGFSDTWQLVINTSTTVLTFLAVFLIQNTQNRYAEAMHLKLDELIRVSTAHNEMIGIEGKPDEEMERTRQKISAEANEVKR